MDNSELTFRPARPGEQERILEIIGQAQAQMRAAGSDQWQDGYPARADIDADIARGAGHVLCRANGTIIAYGALFFDGEPSYATIRGAWTTAGDYVVLHRLAVADGEKRRGVATEFPAPHRLAGPQAGHAGIPRRHELRQPADAAPDGEGALRLLRKNPLPQRRTAGI